MTEHSKSSVFFVGKQQVVTPGFPSIAAGRTNGWHTVSRPSRNLLAGVKEKSKAYTQCQREARGPYKQ
jgi:hypothetical protein